MAASKAKARPSSVDLQAALAWLEQSGTKKTIDGMARYGIPSTNAFGVTVGTTKAFAKSIGKDHELALGLWRSGWYEARLLAGFVDDPAAVTSRQMESWVNDFDSWAICDSICFHLFDRTAHAWSKVHAWASARPEFKKRAAFALLWALTVHDKKAADAVFLGCLPLIERASTDERDYVKKGVDMAVRAFGKRNSALRAAALELARRLSDSQNDTQRALARSVLRELR